MNKLFSKIKNMSIQEKVVMILWILVAIFLIAEVAVLVAYQPTLDDFHNATDAMKPKFHDDAINANNIIAGISFAFGALLLGTIGTTIIVAYHKKHNKYFWQKSKGGVA